MYDQSVITTQFYLYNQHVIQIRMWHKNDHGQMAIIHTNKPGTYRRGELDVINTSLVSKKASEHLDTSGWYRPTKLFQQPVYPCNRWHSINYVMCHRIGYQEITYPQNKWSDRYSPRHTIYMLLLARNGDFLKGSGFEQLRLIAVIPQ